ncbi:MAG TPA: PilT/PilU family type 4a pilus ATPase [Elusimicrobiota bacterium]|nr:PilT/PilU family type 4a pilus ATPase [Elusimicrobiota bacterium]
MAIDVTQLFKTMVRTGISDIHFKAGTPPMVRVHGRMMSSGFTKMAAQHIEELADVLMNTEQKAMFARDKELDISFEVPNVSRFRVNVYRQKGTMALSLRVVPLTLRTLAELNLPEETLKKLCANTRGLILVAGITGAGKTTTLNALIDHINKTYAYNIVTVEDPIEYYHTDAKSSVAQREVGGDTESFLRAMKHVLRQDPDVVVLGEMRDADSIRAGVMAAETGHLVLGTIHTMNAAQTLDRLLEAYDVSEQMGARQRTANILRGIICQRLLETADGNGRVPATEIMVVTSLIQKLMLEGKTAELRKAIEQGNYYGMHSFDQDLLRLVNEKKISKEEALDASNNPDDLMIKLNTQGLSGGAGPA